MGCGALGVGLVLELCGVGVVWEWFGGAAGVVRGGAGVFPLTKAY